MLLPLYVMPVNTKNKKSYKLDTTDTKVGRKVLTAFTSMTDLLALKSLTT